MILFSQISISLLPARVETQTDIISRTLQHPSTYVVLAMLISLRMMLKKTIDEFSFLNKVIYIGVIALIFLLGIKTFDSKNEKITDDPQVKISVLNESHYEKYTDSINITIITYGFMINLFPVATQMKE